MNAPVKFILAAQAGHAERPGIVAGGRALSMSVARALGDAAWPVRILHSPPGTQIANSPSAVLLSLVHELERPDEFTQETEARWRDRIVRFRTAGTPVFVSTIFRHVRDRPRDGSQSPLLERIRRLNRMALDWSREFAVAIVDIDRAFAYVGGRILDTDYAMAGEAAAELAGHTIARSLLSFGFDDLIDPAVQERAKALLGDLPAYARQFDPSFGLHAVKPAERRG